MNWDAIFFGLGGLVGFVVSAVMLFNEWHDRRMLLKANINGTKRMLLSSSFGLQAILLFKQTLFVTLAVMTATTSPPRPAWFGRVIVFGLIAISWLVGYTSIYIWRSRRKIDQAIDKENA